ncbi:MAG: nucleoside-diphosphate kinase [Microbacterium sp.]|nr:MAG: nucleoside-diphosphate kinase [Microbacterium sp.]
MSQRTLVLIKPDGVARGLTGAILARIEQKGYSLVDIKLVEPDRETLEQHYAEHAGKPFYEPLVEFMMSGPSVAIRLAGNRVIEGFRALAGTTDPTTAAAGTIRGDFGRDWGAKVQQNLVHGSDSVESATRELAIWF